MASKYAVNSSTTSGDRLLNVSAAALQLSTGDGVFLSYDPSAAAGTYKIQLFLVTAASGHTSVSGIGNVSAGNFAVGGLPQSLALCRDASDNLYIVGQDNTSGNTMQVGVQAFKKGTGLHWTQQKYLTAYYAGFAANTGVASNFSGFAALWCNTGGGPSGAGHLIVLANEFTLGRNWAFTINAGTALSGDITKGLIGAQLQPPNPGFMGVGGGNTTDGSNLDLEADGFGATYGLSVAGNDTTHCTVGSWGVTAQGVITSGAGMASAQRSTGTLARLTTKLRILRVSSGLWAAIYPSSGTAGRLTVAVFTGSGFVGSVDSTLTSNFPAPSASLSWGAAVDAGGTLWLYGWSSVTATTMLRLPVTVSATAAPTLGAVVTDDTGVTSGTPTTIRVVKQPVDPLHTDWQAYNTVSPYSLVGDFSALTSPPLTATLGPPATGAVAVLATGGTVAWTFNPRNSGDTQSAYYFRRQAQPSSAVEYWNAGTSSWQSTEVSNTSGTQSVTFGTGKWTADTTYSWSVDTVGSTGLRAGYATDSYVLVATSPIPSTPTLTATYDAANNRVTLVIGGTGTLSATVQYSDDGSTWNTQRATPVALVAGAATVYDYEAPPGQARQYRAFQQDASDVYGAPSATSTVRSATPAITTFWLRDPVALSAGITPHVKRGTFSTSIGEAVAVHRPLGRPTAVAIADSTLQGEDGSATFWTNSTSDETALLALLEAQRTLLLQSPDNRAWYIRITSPRPTTPVGLVRPGTAREHAVSWVQTAQP